ncbi:MAG TPA: CheR family methyltransferase, partial [Bacillota bacterium]|nr:CheR family methyltransferase [Bacillota bacterium]
GRGAAAGDELGFGEILGLLRNHAAVDFSAYKSSTIQRRITRRMVLNKAESLEAYARFLRGNSQELDLLYSDLLINVTSFFRTPEAFEALKRKVFPRLLQQPSRQGEPVRFWVLGCSTGQEAYSLAMAWTEFCDPLSRAPQLQLFATDLNEAMLERARRGLYPKSLLQEVSPERLRRFFVEEEGGYRISKTLRQACVFARQNLLSDPPFSRMDLISCRNLLIYIEPALQQKILPAFHYGLKPEGFLFLGASESIGPFTNLFEPVDKKLRLFSRKPGATPGWRFPAASSHPAGKKETAPAQPLPPAKTSLTEANAQREADRLTVARFAPPSVLVNASLQILQFRGPTGAYLQPPTGKPTADLLKLAREELMLPLRAALKKAQKQNQLVRTENVRLHQHGATQRVTLEIVPLKNLKERCYLIFFEHATEPNASQAVCSAPLHEPPSEGPPSGRTAGRSAEARRLADLQRELAETRDYLQSLQEQYEAANEELQSSNEEVTSANEELQSINEELETSKEELESTNEELTTVNEEMANRNQELNRLNADLNNLHVSINTPILLLGRDLTIRRFTPQAEKLFNLLAADIGRPLGGIRHNLAFPGLEQFITESIDSISLREREVQDKDGNWFVLRVRPYLTLDKQIDGAVLVLTDINALKQKEQEITQARNFAQAIIDAVPPLLILDPDLHVQTANQSFYHAFGVSPAQTERRLIYDLGNGQWNIPALRQLLEELLPHQRSLQDYEVAHDFEHLGRRTMLLNACQ